MRPKYSIIVPVYNVAPYLRACLDSVLAQRVPDWECVCVDDGSTDECGKILDEYAERDCRIRVVHKRNEGVSIARNTALDMITGGWFLFLDSDDVWSPDLLLVCERVLAEHPGASLVKFKDKHFPERSICEFDDMGDRVPPVAIFDMAKEYDYRHCGFLAPKLLFNRAQFGDIRQKSYSVGEDILYMAECSMRAEWLLDTKLPLYGYRDRMGSAVRRKGGLKMVLDAMHFYADIVELYGRYKKPFSADTKRWIGNALTERAVWECIHLSSRSDREAGLRAWGDVLNRMSKYPILGLGQNLRIRLLNLCPGGLLMMVFCIIPSCLKRKGFHR